jgi:hypothetical protein
MKRTIPKRSAEELEKFFKKSSYKAVVDNLKGQKSSKKPVSVHQIIEKAVSNLDIPFPMKNLMDDTDIDLDLDDLPLDFEEE